MGCSPSNVLGERPDSVTAPAPEQTEPQNVTNAATMNDSGSSSEGDALLETKANMKRAGPRTPLLQPPDTDPLHERGKHSIRMPVKARVAAGWERNTRPASESSKTNAATMNDSGSSSEGDALLETKANMKRAGPRT